jgi:hypothetical protein
MKRIIFIFSIYLSLLSFVKAQGVKNISNADNCSNSTFLPTLKRTDFIKTGNISYAIFSTTGKEADNRSNFFGTPDYQFGPEGGLAYQKGLYGELGVAYSDDLDDGEIHFLMDTYKIAAQYNFNSSSPIFVPKVCAEFNLLILCFRANMEDFTDFHINDYRVTPEVGICFLGIVSLCYGWNIPLTNNRLGNVGAHVLSLNFTYNGPFMGGL